MLASRLPSIEAIDRARVEKGGLAAFARIAWPVVAPESPLAWGWHMTAICDACEDVSLGRTRNLLINVPPGTGKSILTGVMWPAWEWIHRPATKWLSASYDPALAYRDAGKVRDLISSHWYVSRWGERIKPGPVSVSDIQTRAGGFLFSTSPKGRATGRHVNIAKVDDPIKPLDAMGGAMLSTATLDAVRDWWAGTIATRRADPKTFARAIIMQRLHEEDPSGDAIKAGYRHLCLPMRYDPDHPYKSPEDRRTELGELLFPERYTAEVVDSLERDLGPYHAAGQLAQLPIHPGGSIFAPEDLRTWGLDGAEPPDGMWWQSWDLSFKGHDGSDFVAGGVFVADRTGIYLVDITLERMSFTSTVEAIRRTCKSYPRAWTVLVEDKANGPAVEDALRAEIQGLTMVDPMGGKEARAHAASPFVRGRKFFLPPADRAPVVVEVERQMVKFPKTKHDDAVDMITQALVWYRGLGMASLEDASSALARLTKGK